MTRLFALLTLAACGSPAPIHDVPDLPPESTGLMARISAASCGLDVTTWSIDLHSEKLTVRTVDGETHELTLPAAGAPCVLPAAYDLDLDALIALSAPCAEALGSVGGSRLLTPERASWVSWNPEHLLITVPETEPTSIPSGRDVAIALPTGRCSAAVMD
ncbi:MAG: hypothetical protein EP330_12885 [Deltaproteobacteria bacterium]|nr:MAG: hypothetical protein EP330_12885 [Deltaproteobacteria bacterium]